MAGEEAADRAVAEDEALALKRAAQFLDRNVRRRLHNGEDRVLVRLDPARPAIATRRPGASLTLLPFERPPPAHARRADPKPLACRTDSPRATAASTRTRRSNESDVGMSAGLHPADSLNQNRADS